MDYVTLEVGLSRTDGGESDSDGPNSTEQGDGIGDVMLWAFKIDTQGNVAETATGWRTVSNVNTFQTIGVHLPLPTCDGSQDYMVVAVLNKAEFGGASFGSSTTYSQLKAMTFDASARPFWQTYPNDNTKTPEDMPVSNWAKIKIAGKSYDINGNVTSKGNTHSSNCYSLNLPVYRAVAKAQLYFRKSSDDFKLEITDAKILSKKMPTNGAVLSATVGSQTDTKNTEATTDDVTIALGNPDNSATPSWYTGTAITAANPGEVQLKNSKDANEATVFSPVSRPKNHASVEGNPAASEYVWAGSAFLYENQKGWNSIDWTTYDCSSEPTADADAKGGYYMQVKYKIDDGGELTGYVPMPSFVRNHDYQVYLTVDAGGKLTLTLQVNEWKEDEVTYNYTEQVTVEGANKLTWTAKASESEANGVNTVTLAAADANNSTPYAVCEFYISTPEDAEWHAAFVEGAINAFEFFVDADENGVSTISGAVGAKNDSNQPIKSTIKIRAKQATVPSNAEAFLSIVVVTPDGRTLPTDVLTGGVRQKILQTASFSQN